MRLTNEELTKKINELVIKWKGKKPKVNDWLNPTFREWRIDQTRYWTYRDWLKNSDKKDLVEYAKQIGLTE